jgi:hypothetical protein
MPDRQPFLSQTALTASFAFRQYFQPLVVAARFLRPKPIAPEAVESAAQDRLSLEVAEAILRQRLAHGRRYERLLLVLGTISALGSLLALAISLMFASGLGLPVTLAILIPASTFALWILVRLVQTREEIIELKTIRWVIKSVDRETAERVAQQVSWGRSPRKRKPRTDKNPT